MTFSFQVILKDDEEFGYIFGAILGRLIGAEKDVKELKNQIESLKTTHIESVSSVADAKRVMQKEGYIFYKKPEVWGQKSKSNGLAIRPRRKRRTKREMEEAKRNE